MRSISPLASKLGAFAALSNNELNVLDQLHRRRRTFASGRDLVHQGQSSPTSYVLAKGWAVSYKILEDGSRQILNIKVPGDIMGLRNTASRVSDHAIEPVTNIEISEVLPSDLLEDFRENPRLATAVQWSASRDHAILAEHLVSIGRRDATRRVAHFFLEMEARLRLVGIGTNSGYFCPLTQYLLADALGLSAVHVNRCLRTLREDGLVTFQAGEVVFDDHEGLVEFAKFDPAYLDQIGPLLH